MRDPQSMTAEAQEHYLAAVHIHHLCELVQRWCVDPEELLAGVAARPGEDLTAQGLQRPGARLSLETCVGLFERARAMTNEPGLGIYLGLDMHLSSHGFVGFAAMTVPTVRDAVQVATRFAPTRTNAFRLRYVETPDEGALIIDELCDIGDARDLILFAFMLGLGRFVAVATRSRNLFGNADFAFDKPAYADRFLSQMRGMQCRFGQPQNRIRCAAVHLDVRLRNADPAALMMARAQCEKEMLALGFGEDIVPRVRGVLPAPAGGYRSLSEVARRLGFSERTLKRRLSARGASFSSVLDELRMETAMLMLQAANSSHEEIASRLGYSDASAFSKAFRRWTGLAPGEFSRSSESST